MRSLEPGAEATQEAKQHLPAKCLHVLALQGKSRHLSAWLLQDLVDSNENLRQLDPEREASELEYIVPEGGLGKGLCGKAILLKHPWIQTNSTICNLCDHMPISFEWNVNIKISLSMILKN